MIIYLLIFRFSRAIDHLGLKILMVLSILQVFRFKFLKFSILEVLLILNEQCILFITVECPTWRIKTYSNLYVIEGTEVTYMYYKDLARTGVENS